MSRFLALIMVAAMALFIAGPAVAQEAWDVSKSYTFNKTNTDTGTTDIKVKKNVNIGVSGDLPAKGKLDVQGDVVFKELDVQVQDEEVVNKFFELDDSASSTWSTSGTGFMAAAEQLQNGLDNTAHIHQTNQFAKNAGMHVGLQYQVGNLNDATINQTICHHEMNNFAKQVQVGNSNTAFGQQD